ncbi:MAG: NAD(P)/FAD-dependent oxidoreductase [Chloroflexota bacterium]
MKIAIIGAGIGGMAAAYDLARAGHQVAIYEAADYVGGLSSGFKEPHWEWSVERYYHHWFASDQHILNLIDELGLREKVVFPRPYTVVYHHERFYPLDSPLAALTFPGFNFFDMARFGLVTTYLRYLSRWQPLERYTAVSWLRRWYGTRLYIALVEPLLMGKFGPHYQEVTMAWFWARTKARTTRLGTYEGGFQAFADTFADKLRRLGVEIRLSTPASRLSQFSAWELTIETSAGPERWDRCLVTVSPTRFAHLAPDLPAQYQSDLLSLKSMGAVTVVLALKHQLSTEGYYWYNIPKSAGFPFLILVEHTNFIPASKFGDDHIVYIGDYLELEHEYFQLSKEELLDRFLPSLPRINPKFTPDWVRDGWLFRTNYAQPVPLVDHSKNLPPIQTPVAGLYFASMSQVYPWDRGTNFAVALGREAARLMMQE